MRELPADSFLRVIAREVAPHAHEMLTPFVPWHRRAVEPTELDFYEWYYAYGRLLKPQTMLEIGVLGGASVVAVCLGAGSSLCEVHLIDDESHDRRESLADAANAVMRAAPCAQVSMFREDSQRLARLPAGPQFDLISLDGDHRVGPCFHDLRICLPRLAEDGHVLVDDAQWSWVQEACDAFTAVHPELDDLFVATKTGTRVLHRAGEHLLRCPLLIMSNSDESRKPKAESR